MKQGMIKKFLSQKKGQGISLNVIIVAAIGLVVLVLLVAIFTGQIKVFDHGVGDAKSIGTSNVCRNSANRVCSNDAAAGTLIPKPEGGWMDCSNNCYVKAE